MIRDDWNDLEPMKENKHIEQVWRKIRSKFPDYFARYSSGRSSAVNGLFGGAAAVKAEPCAQLRQRVAKAVEEYERSCQDYRQFFDPRAMAEHVHDPRQFGRDMVNLVPIIRRAVHSEREEMQEWRAKFNRVRSRQPGELLRVFTHQIQLVQDYPKKTSLSAFGKISERSAFGFDDLDAGVEDEKVAHLEGHAADEEGLIKYGKYHILGVVGLGIISTVLWNHNPGCFPYRGRYGLAGLYFLTDKDDFGLPSSTSEFVMFTPMKHGDKIEHNFYYPYSLFALYSMRLSRLLKQEYDKCKVAFDPKYRFVYTEDFLAFVADEHQSEMEDWREYDA